MLRLRFSIRLRFRDQVTVLIPRFAFPTCREQFTQLEAREDMRLCVEDNICEWQYVARREQKVEIFECLGLQQMLVSVND